MTSSSSTGPDKGCQADTGYLLGGPRIRNLAARVAHWMPLGQAPRLAPDPASTQADEGLLGVTRAEIYLTSACNLRCRYCTSRHRRTPPWDRRVLFELLQSLARTGTRHLQWTGGEASCHPGLVSFVRHASALGMSSSMSTNGTADPALYESLWLAGMGRFYISLDLLDQRSFDRAVGAEAQLERVKDNISRLCSGPAETRPHVTVNCVLDGSTTYELMARGGSGLRELLSWYRAVGVDDFKFLPASTARMVTIFPDQGAWDRFEALCRQEVPATYPMFHYRLGSLRRGGHGLQQGRPHHCYFCLDDRAFDSQGAYPCIVRLREGAPSLYAHGDDTRDRVQALANYLATDRACDPICRAHCYDLYRELSQAVGQRLHPPAGEE